MNVLKNNNFSSMAKEAPKIKRKGASWEDDSRAQIDPEDEIRTAFTMMTDDQLRYHMTLGGKNKKYAEALLKHRGAI